MNSDSTAAAGKLATGRPAEVVRYLLRLGLLGFCGLVAHATLLALVVTSVGAAIAAEKFRKLAGPEIRARFSGMLLSDEQHWSILYERSGKAIKGELKGTWHVQNNQLCTDFEDEGKKCSEVWMAGRRVQLRSPGSSDADAEGTLLKPKR